MLDYFHLPISFLENKKQIEKHVINDLELQNNKDTNTKSLYDYVFKTDNCPFAKKIIPLWSAYYTSDKQFLKDSQTLIKNKVPRVNGYKDIDELWREIKGEKYFESKYLYVDWDYFKFLNNSSTFLQCMSIYNMSSPVFSLALPIFFMIIPFIIIKFQGIEITVSKYMEILKYMSQRHQLGQIFMIESASWDKRIYIIMSLFFYFFQIYQNILSCIKFYKNMTNIHEQIFTIKNYVKETINTMDMFEIQCKSLKTYKPFIIHMNEKREILKKIFDNFDCVSEYKICFKKFSEIGAVMKNFYSLYKNKEYHNALEYSFGFNGYMHNLNSLKKSFKIREVSSFKILGIKNKMSNIERKSNKTKFKNAYFPSLINKNPVKNTYKLNKSMLITGPNAAGKTTLIKTTIFNILFSQQCGFGFYESASFTPFDYIHCYINIPDTSGRDSLFQSEARRCKDIIDIMKNAGPKSSHFCVFDELYSGTNPYEAIASATSFLRYLNIYTNTSYMITTHFLDICDKMKNDKMVSNMHMKIDKNENDDFEYSYKLQSGISHIKGGIKVLRDLEYPEYIVNETKKMINNIII